MEENKQSICEAVGMRKQQENGENNILLIEKKKYLKKELVMN